ncbi:MAG: sodium:solute symporter [Gemmataceae bacterium]|nr:sodium:solute symporter [Gemmataceae bacterium]
MSGRLSPPDVAVVLAYILGTTALGVWCARRQRTLRTYFVGDRNVAWWLILISIVTTETSAVTFLSVPGLSYAAGGNLAFLQLAVGYVVGRILIAWLLLPLYLRGEVFSAYEVLRQRFGPAVQRTASALFLLTRTVADGLRLYLAGLLLHSCTGWDIALSVLAMAAVTLAYTFFGGMKAVIWTDVIQFLLKVGGGLVALLVIIAQLPNGWTTFTAVGHEAGKFTVFNFELDWTEPYTFWAGLIGGGFFTMASHGADQMMVQRYLCSRSLGEARAALILSGFTVLLQFVLFLLVGVGLFVLTRTGQLSPPPGTRNDEVFGYFIVNYLPVGLVGLVIAAVLAAAMSTLSGSLNSSASAAVSDFYRPLRPGRSEGHYLAVSRGLTVFWGLAQVGVGLVAVRFQEQRSVVNDVLAVAGFTTGMVLGLFVLRRLPRPVSSWAALTGLVAGFLAVFAVWLPPRFGYEGLAWPWYAPIGTSVTVAAALAAQALRNRHAGPPADRGTQSVLDEPG